MKPSFLDRIKQSALVIVIGFIFSFVPFYYQTTELNAQSLKTNTSQNQEISKLHSSINKLEVQSAVDDTKIKQIKESLDRIEQKIDRIIEKSPRTAN